MNSNDPVTEALSRLGEMFEEIENAVSESGNYPYNWDAFVARWNEMIAASVIEGQQLTRLSAANARQAEELREWRRIAEALWGLLDDISTLDDAAKSDDSAFRKHAYRIAEKRGGYLRSLDGQTLELTPGASDVRP